MLLLGVFLAALVAIACGGGNSDADDVESVLRAYIGHYVDSEPAEMYALLDSASRESCPEEDFVAFITRTRDALGDRDFEVVEVRDIVIEGDSATATVISNVAGEPADPTENALHRESGDWKLELPSPGC